MKRWIVAAIVTAVVAAFSAGALAQTTRLRADVVVFDGTLLGLKTVGGRELSVRVDAKTTFTVPRALSLADIRPGDYVGSAATPGPDGKLVAREVHVFPESQRGTGDGHRPWDGEPGATMTNGGVAQVAQAANGRELRLQYQGGEKTIVVPERTPIVTFQPGDASLLVPGSYVVVTAQASPDGSLTALRIQATSRDGVRPPG